MTGGNLNVFVPVGVFSRKPLLSLELRFGLDAATGQYLQSGRVRNFRPGDVLPRLSNIAYQMSPSPATCREVLELLRESG